MDAFGKSESVNFMVQNLSYTGTLARQYDPDRFFLTLLEPVAVRPALWALLAFNYEIAKTREVVSEPTLGFMRLQWWRDALEKIYAGNPPPKHEVLEPLAEAIHQYSLPFDLFDRLITGREFDLEGGAPETIEALKDYLSGTVTPLTLLMLRVCQQAEAGADSISQAYGIAGVMRAIPFQAQQGRCFVPQHLATADQLFRDQGRRQEAMIVLHNEAGQALVDAGSFTSKMLMHMGNATNLYLRHMERLEYNLLDGRFSEAPPFFHLRMWLKY